MYFLLDANVTAAYYLARSTKSKKTQERIENIFDSVRSGEREHFFYIPNFCVAEVVSVFMKYSFGTWNSLVKTPIDTRHYNRIVGQFEDDIHNGKFLYHYELSRYHVLGINHVAPIDHYFQIKRKKKSKSKKKSAVKMVKPNVNPMGTIDHLIISMGIHLAHLHGRENVAILSSDERLTSILAKCKSNIPKTTQRRLKLNKVEKLTGKAFRPDIFPEHLDLTRATNSELRSVIGEWPLPVGKVPKVGRYLG
jgi:hypothetical protein